MENGNVYLVDRLKEIINVDCFVVAPAELENALYDCPGLEDVAEIGAGHGVDEHPVVFVVSAEGERSTARILEHLSYRLWRYKAERYEVRFVDSVPRGGKIL